MTKRYGRVALYELVGKSRLKTGENKVLDQSTETTSVSYPAPVTKAGKVSTAGLKWPRKPKPIQFNTGRIETAIPYQYAAIGILGVLLALLVVFRLGQFSVERRVKASVMAIKNNRIIAKEVKLPDVEKIINLSSKPIEVQAQETVAKMKMVEPMGDHRIVLKQYQVMADLVPAQKYFERYGIETQIEKRGSWYFLITKNRYQNPTKKDTDGFLEKQKIMKIGANYKAPQGYDSFGTKPFQDVYGEKVK